MQWQIIQNHDHHMGSSPYCSKVPKFTLIKSASRAWCKTIVTTSFYIRSYNSFAPSPRHTILPWASCTANIHQDSQCACPHLPGRTWSGRTRGPLAYTTQYSGGRLVPRPWEYELSEIMEGGYWTWSGRTRGPPAYTTQYSGGRRVPRPWEYGLSEIMEGDITHKADEQDNQPLTSKIIKYFYL